MIWQAADVMQEVKQVKEVELKRLKAAHVKLGNAVEQNAEVFGEGGKEQIPDALRALLDEHGCCAQQASSVTCLPRHPIP
eukprot:1412845-Amphidinium_carterae.1